MKVHRKQITDVALGLITALAIAIAVNQWLPWPENVAMVRYPGSGTVAVEGWRDHREVGHRVGPEGARVVIVLFSDFECGFCREVAADLKHVRAQFPRDVSMVYRHFPVGGAETPAFDAALASECAAAQGRFEKFHDVLFERQDSLAERRWGEWAAEADVPDLHAFDACFQDRLGRASVEFDAQIAGELGLAGTPTLLINELLVQGSPGRERLVALVRTALAGAETAS